MLNWNYQEVANYWLDYIDTKLFEDDPLIKKEIWHKTKTLILDSIESLDYIRKKTDNPSRCQDNRFNKLVDICELDCRGDYFQRFYGYNKKYYQTENLWWIDCWESIRLNNKLHELSIRNITDFFEESQSGGKEFKEKWKKFYNYSKTELYKVNSLPAFSYIECIRFKINISEKLSIEELKYFLTNLYEYDGDNLKYYPNSNEIRCRALDLINLINQKSPGKYNLDDIYINLKKCLTDMIGKCKWDRYSHTWFPILLSLQDNRILELVKIKIPKNVTINSTWISGNNFHRIPRFALLLLYEKLQNDMKYFEIIEPNRFVYTPINYLRSFIGISKIISNTIQAFNEVKDIQKQIQNNSYNENYFRDLVRLGFTGAISETGNIKWVEKEKDTPSGRKVDIHIEVKKGPNISIEMKILWRFNKGYEPIGEILEQIIHGNFGITANINPPENPIYLNKYQDFEGLKKYVEDHKTYINGTIRESNNQFENISDLKTKHFYSDHQHFLGGKPRNVTLLHFFIDLRDFTRSPHLAKL